MALVLAFLCCASTPDPDGAPRPTPPDTGEIQALPGYRASRFTSESFPDDIYVMEAGPKEVMEAGPNHVMEAGSEDTTTVLLLHGISRDGAHDWDALVPVLAGKYHVLTLDLPGFGRSKMSNAPFGPKSYADLIDELVAARVSGPFDVVAHSMGVSVALEVALRHPDRVRRLVLVDAAGLLNGQSLGLEQLERQRDRLGFVGDWLAPLQRGAYDVLGRLPEKLAQRFAIAVPGEAAGQAAARLMAHDSGPALDAVRAPTLVIWGRDDDVVSPRGAWVLFYRLANARLALIDGAGHLPMRDRPKEFDDLVTRWLAGDDDVGRAVSREPASDTRGGECRGNRHHVEFEGAYRKISIDRCPDVLLRGVRAQEIEIADSTVVARDTIVKSDEVAVVVWHSRLKLSGGELSARVPLRLSNSEVDLAGVTFEGGTASVDAIGDAKVLCSLCRLKSEAGDERLHGFREMHATDRL
jgi:pimeloyl-ACP methyl ester carboxylesterase